MSRFVLGREDGAHLSHIFDTVEQKVVVEIDGDEGMRGLVRRCDELNKLADVKRFDEDWVQHCMDVRDRIDTTLTRMQDLMLQHTSLGEDDIHNILMGTVSLLQQERHKVTRSMVQAQLRLEIAKRAQAGDREATVAVLETL